MRHHSRNATFALSQHPQGRRYPLMVGAAVTASLIAACGGTGTNSTGDGPDGDGSSPGSDGSTFDADVLDSYERFARDHMPGIDPAAIQDAKDEGTVVFYTSNNATSNLAADAFQRQFPFIEIEMFQTSGGNVDERFSSEMQAGLNAADLIAQTSVATVMDYVDQGWCAEYLPFNDEFYSDDVKVPGMAYQFAGSLQGLNFVPDRLTEEEIASLQSWDTLFDDRWAGRPWGWVDIAAGGTTVYNNAALYTVLGPDVYQRHVSVIGQDSIQVFGSGNPATNAVLQGEVLIAGPTSNAFAANLYEVGAPIGFVAPEPTFSVPLMGCVATDGPNPQAARLFWEFMLTEPGQTVMLPAAAVSYREGFTAEYPENLVAEPWFEAPDPSGIVTLTGEEIASITDDFTEQWRTYIGAME